MMEQRRAPQKKLSLVPSKQNQVWTQDPLAAEPATNMNAFCKYFFVFAGH